MILAPWFLNRTQTSAQAAVLARIMQAGVVCHLSALNGLKYCAVAGVLCRACITNISTIHTQPALLSVMIVMTLGEIHALLPECLILRRQQIFSIWQCNGAERLSQN